GAALGEDLEASGDDGAPMHWAGPMPAEGDPALPAGTAALSQFVSGSDLLGRRLAQIGVVDDADAGRRLQPQLKTGQRLVTRQGDLWRWDGFVSAADAVSPAAERLAQRNRLAELDAEVDAARRERNARRAAMEAMAATLEQARAVEKADREAWRQAQHQIGVVQQ